MAPSPALVEDKLLGRTTRFPRHALAAYRASLQAIPPRNIYERQNVAGSQIKVRDPSRLSGRRILIVTGECDTDHAREVDGEVARWLSANGAHVDYWYLTDFGIGGNGHMMMLEDNSDAIAHLIAGWVAATVR
ncbi:MAG: hypothetical protein FJX67_06850 [Alphaproteobacteria bacterium]|nr:hypothetical protein [Alphaproteobacteria bacterium]